jgi:galacturan 1,4-alpha-galacturonidase
MMKFIAPQTYVLGLLFLTLLTAATPVCQQKLLIRPIVRAGPKAPAVPHFQSPERTKVCYVRAFGDGKDDSQTLFSAAKACNNGGTVALLDPIYIIAQAVDLTFLSSVDFDIQGVITFTNDTAYWMEKSFKYTFQGGSSFWQFGGNDVNFYGGGTLDGGGQVWYDLFAKNSTIARPVLFAMVGMHHASMSNINMINPPNWFNWISDSSDLIISDVALTAQSSNQNPVKNSGLYPFNSHRLQPSHANHHIQMDGIHIALTVSQFKTAWFEILMTAFLSNLTAQTLLFRICSAMVRMVSL